MKPGNDAWQRSQSYPVVDRVVAFLLGQVGTVAPVLAIDLPNHPLGWFLLVAGGLAAGAAAAGLVPWLRTLYQSGHDNDPQAPDPGPPRPRRRRRLMVWSTVLTSSLAIGVWGSLVLPGAIAAVRIQLEGCPRPVELRVLTSPGSVEAASSVADTYERWTAARFHDCPTARLYVYPVPAREIRDGLRNGWPDAMVARWPRPDVWLADSSVEVDMVQGFQTGLGTQFTIAERTVVAGSPLVLAVPAEAAEAAEELPPELRTSATWGDLLSVAQDHRWHVLRPEPTLPGGQLATAAVYGANGGVVTSATAARWERLFATSLDAGAYPADDEEALLCRFRSQPEAASRTVLMLTEQTMIGYNQGRVGVGSACAPSTEAVTPPAPNPTPDASPSPDTSPGASQDPDQARSERAAERSPALLAYYPTDTLRADWVFVRFDWQDGTGPAEPAAAEFGAWLASPDGQRALLDVGLRSATTLTDPISARWGALPSAGPGGPADPERVAEADRLRRQVARHGRLLVLLDTSGSMSQSATATHSRFEVAAAAVVATAGQAITGDAFGLWTFAAPGDQTVLTEHLPVAAAPDPATVAARRAQADRALAEASLAGNTPLYQAIAAGIEEVGPGDDEWTTALIVITDGEDTGGGPSPAELAAQVRNGGPRVFVVAVGEATCADPDLSQIITASGGGCVHAGFDTLDRALAGVTEVIWGGDPDDH